MIKKNYHLSVIGAPVVNSLFRQRACIENILKACLGLPAENNMLLEYMLPAKVFMDLKKEDQQNVQTCKCQH